MEKKTRENRLDSNRHNKEQVNRKIDSSLISLLEMDTVALEVINFS